MEAMKKKEVFAAHLRSAFEEADESGDGAISQDKFESMIENKHIMAKFQGLGLELDELMALFSVLSEDDGVADYEEFLQGALKMKGSARTIDTMQLLHEQLK